MSPETPDPYFSNETFRVHFRDQLLALIQSNPHGAMFDHLFWACCQTPYLNTFGKLEDLGPVTLCEELFILKLDGKLTSSGPWNKGDTIWKSTAAVIWSEFDEFALGFGDD